MSETGCRIDVWLWRARFFKTRSLAATFADGGRVHLTRGGQDSRIDKASRAVKLGDQLVFGLSGKLIAIRVEALGDRRGPASEARLLYETVDEAQR